MNLSKLFLSAMAVASFANVAEAADISSCLTRVYDACRVRSQERSVIENAESCKIVQASGIQNVVFFGPSERRVTSVDTKRCDVSDLRLYSDRVVNPKKESKVFEGRLFFVLESGRAMFVGRNNNVYELENSKGESYSTIVGLRVDQANDAIILERQGGQDVTLTLEQIQNRIDSGKTKVISRSID